MCGGSFTSLGGVPRANAAALSLATGGPLNWSPALSAPVEALAIVSDRVFAGGSFTECNGQAVAGLVALDPLTGANAEPWTFTATNRYGTPVIRTLLPLEDSLFVGGQFDHVGTGSGRILAAIDPMSGEARSSNADFRGGSQGVWALAASGGLLYAAGDFTSVASRASPRLAAVDPVTGAAAD